MGSPTPTPTATTQPVATIPTDCRSVVAADQYDRLFGATEPTLMSGDAPEIDPSYPTTDLYCLWGTNSGLTGWR